MSPYPKRGDFSTVEDWKQAKYAWMREYRAQNKDKLNAKKRRKYWENSDVERARARRTARTRYREDPEHFRERSRANRRRPGARQAANEYQREWYRRSAERRDVERRVAANKARKLAQGALKDVERKEVSDAVREWLDKGGKIDRVEAREARPVNWARPRD